MCAVDSMRKMYILKMIYYAVDDLYDLLCCWWFIWLTMLLMIYMIYYAVDDLYDLLCCWWFIWFAMLLMIYMIYYAVDDLYDLLWVKCNITSDHM